MVHSKKLFSLFLTTAIALLLLSCEMTVSVTGVTLNKSELTLFVGEQATLEAMVLPEKATDKTIAWGTTDASVATVKGGVVTAISKGKATIVVGTVDGNYRAKCVVTVKDVELKEDTIEEILGVDYKTKKVIVIPDNVTEIGNNAFRNCTNLEKVTIGDGVTSIGSYAFSGCTNLTDVTFGKSVTSTGYDAFDSCSSLTNVYVDSIETWCAIDFNAYDGNPLFSASHLFVGGTEVIDLVIPDRVKNINSTAFVNLPELTSVVIPSSVTYIGSSAFKNCENLTSVTFKNTTGWFYASSSSSTSGTEIDVTNPEANATNLTSSTWGDYHLRRK